MIKQIPNTFRNITVLRLMLIYENKISAQKRLILYTERITLVIDLVLFRPELGRIKSWSLFKIN